MPRDEKACLAIRHAAKPGASAKGSAAHLTGRMSDWLPRFLLHRSTLLQKMLPDSLPSTPPDEEKHDQDGYDQPPSSFDEKLQPVNFSCKKVPEQAEGCIPKRCCDQFIDQ